jgi:hypothetical protein
MIYNIKKSWTENLSKIFPTHKYPNKPVEQEFIGLPISTRIGIAAGPLLNSEWIKYASSIQDFSILTYKTIRSKAY